MTKERVNVYLKPETKARIAEMADRLGVSHTRIASMAIEAGLDALKMAINPDFKTFFEEQMKHEQEADRKQGVEKRHEQE